MEQRSFVICPSSFVLKTNAKGKPMKKIVCFCSMMASLAAFAGSAVVDGTDFVVTAAAGESFTNSTAVGDYARLVKRGAGEVVLTAGRERSSRAY